jgi:glycosyltransferase involved in cell wall biosynthesis
MSKISAIVIAKNEEINIINCLKTLLWTNEIILVDNCSKDKTVSLAKKFTSKIFATSFKSFAKKRELGQKRARFEWLFYLDADERVGRTLRDEIKQAVKEEKYDAYEIPRLNILFGKKMQHGGWYPDYNTRLIKKKKLLGWFGKVHESPKINGKIGRLRNPIIHLTHQDTGSCLKSINEWSQIEADLLFKNNHPPVTLFTFFKIIPLEFFRRLIFKRGFQDGIQGFIESFLQAFNVFIVYTRLWELQKEKLIKQTYREIEQKISDVS